MNGLTLRIVRGGTNKLKSQIGYYPINITEYLKKSGVCNELFRSFSEANSTDEQLTILKKTLDQCKDVNCEVIKFIVVVFLLADAKHPVKSFLTRYVTRNKYLQQPFTDTLATEIQLQISLAPSHYNQYVDVVSKVFMCIENFHVGVAAVKLMETNLAAYLGKCLEFCVKILSENKTLAPTEKNEIFNLVHLSLRLLLHIVQRVNEDSINKLIIMFGDVKICIQQLMFNIDVPMDTKSVCGILYLCMHMTEYGSVCWIDILNPPSSNELLVSLMEDEASQLSLYSAIATVITLDTLQTHTVGGKPAIVVLLERIMDIGDRSASDSTYILGVTRTVLQISKMLDRLTDRVARVCIVNSVLAFTWSHLDHYMDSVRHLTAQVLSTVVMYCARLDREGDDKALASLQNALDSVDRSGKSYYVCVRCLVSELGSSRVLHTWPTLVSQLLEALSSQHVQASATTTLETLLQNYAKSCSTEELHEEWVRAILSYVEHQDLDSSVLNILESLLVMSLKLNHRLLDYIIPYIKESCETSICASGDLKCTLMLLSVVRHSGTNYRVSPPHGDHLWKGIISYHVLEQAAIDAVDETRILSLSLVVESPKTTEQFTANDLWFVLYYLKYNINAQAPNIRQHTLSLMKKFLKRFEDSYKVIKRQNEPVDHYLRFVEELREQCFCSLIPAANYSRRCVALQLLAWTGLLQLQLPGYNRTWKSDYVDKLLLHLEDSYENNKMLALEVLNDCPVEMLKCNNYSISLDIKDIFAQASSLKPTDCVSAAYKLDLLRRKLPDIVLRDEPCCAADPVTYTLVVQLLHRVRRELRVCAHSVVRAARSAPVYGVLHCVAHLLNCTEHRSISGDPQWTSLVEEIISTCMSVNAAVSTVVNNSSPEGHLPMDMTGLVVSDDGNSGGVTLEDGRQVTAQMVLLCAWRSVKEVSLLLGAMCLRLSVAGEEGVTGTLSADQLKAIGEHFTTLLTETQHRGAFEQAYVGFTNLLTRLWRCRSPELHSLPARWLSELGAGIVSGDIQGSRDATRRSAGLPFMIQALVTSELQVVGRSSCLHSCLWQLLSAARSASSVPGRVLALNVVRSLFRHAALRDHVAPFVGDALALAIDGFERDSWPERNSSTLLFSALMVRVFGAVRTRHTHTDKLHLRNKMTGRIFFLRYPQLYDFILKKLKEVRVDGETQELRPSLYPVLLLLARLYPSSLEGTVSNLKLVAFIPHVVMCGASRVLKTRQLAAVAALPLVSPHQYIEHIKSLFSMLRRDTPRNLCHGVLLQLVELLQHRPPNLQHLEQLQDCASTTLWVLQQAVGAGPCYLIADEYLKIINLFLSNFPKLLEESTIEKIKSYLETLIFICDTPQVTSGRDLCLSNAICLYFILLHDNIDSTCELVQKSLTHSSYEVILSTLNFLLILHEDFDEDKCIFLEHLSLVANKKILDTLRINGNYLPTLCNVLKHEYLESQQKSLKILNLEGNTQKFIIEAKFGKEISENKLIEKLLLCVRTEHDNLTHIYLESLLNLVTTELAKSTICGPVLLDVIRLVFEYSSSDNSECTRSVVVGFIEKNIARLINFDTRGLSEEDIFEVRATTWCTIITLMEDDEPRVRSPTCSAVTSLGAGVTSPGAGVASPGADLRARVPRACADLVLSHIQSGQHAAAILVLIALLDFRSVVLTDDGNDECRVFDQNEKYNIYLEETIWTCRCAKRISNYHDGNDTLVEFVSSLVDHQVYRRTMDNLCGANLVIFKKMIAGENIVKCDAVNPKIELFVKKLCS